MNENDKGGSSRRRSSRRRNNRTGKAPELAGKTQALQAKPQGPDTGAERKGQERKGRRSKPNQAHFDKSPNRGPAPERLHWTPTRTSAPNLPKPECPRCGLPIDDLAAAVNDHDTGAPAHFDCIVARIADSEHLSEGDKVVYIGGGRFGVIHFDNSNEPKKFQIKKTVQWEEKDKRAPWRRDVADQYSST
ncbi:hypothetical protein MASR2M78_18640 [Treponema sp.]